VFLPASLDGTTDSRPVSPDVVETFRRQGFLTLSNLTTLDEIRRIRTSVEALYARLAQLPRHLIFDLGDAGAPEGAWQIPEINRVTVLDPALQHTLAFRRCRAIAECLLGGRVRYYWDHAIAKPPHNRSATVWHQDQAYTHADDPFKSVTFWIALQDVTPEMGCMQFIPGSHVGPLLPHHPRGHSGKAHALEAEGVDGTAAVACPLRAGDATAHLPRTLHYTGPNTTAKPRLAWIVEFGRRPSLRTLMRPARVLATLRTRFSG
jgi:hypothetical protein